MKGLRLIVLATLAVSLTGCIDIKKRVREDRRSPTNTPTAEPKPIVPGEKDPAPATPPPKVVMPAAGRYALTQYGCPGNKLEDAKGDLMFVGTGDGARFERALTATCTAFQPVTRTYVQDNITFTFDGTSCEGVCGELCVKQLVAETGSRRTYQHIAKEGGFKLQESGTTFPAACDGKTPVTMHFATRDPTTCSKRWTASGNEPTDTALVLEGSLKWSAGPLNQGAERTLSQDGLKGDFTVTVKYTDFATEGRGGYFRLNLESMADAKSYAYAMVSSNTLALGAEPALVAAIGTDGTFSEDANANVVARTGRIGELTIKRSGRDITVAAKDGDGHAAVRILAADATFAAEPFRIRLQLGNNYFGAPSIPAAGISVDDVIVNDTRLNVMPQSDRFECDSL